MSFSRKMKRKAFLKEWKLQIKRQKELRKRQGYPVAKDKNANENIPKIPHKLIY